MNAKFTSILKVQVSVLTYAKALQSIQTWIKLKQKSYVCVAAVHLIMECQKNGRLLNGVNKASLVTPDGMPLVWLSRLYGRKVTRVYGPTLMLRLCGLAEKQGYRIFLVGGSRGQTQILKKQLLKQFPKLLITGTIDTPIRPIPPAENRKIVQRINKSHSAIVFVGLGCPLQEWWMIDNRKKLTADVLVGVGAAFDFISGTVKQAPPIFQNIGLEWFFRLLQDPKRLWYRYSVLNALFIIKIIRQLVEDKVFVNNRY